jgi:hypothetical protein
VPKVTAEIKTTVLASSMTLFVRLNHIHIWNYYHFILKRHRVFCRSSVIELVFNTEEVVSHVTLLFQTGSVLLQVTIVLSVVITLTLCGWVIFFSKFFTDH